MSKDIVISDLALRKMKEIEAKHSKERLVWRLSLVKTHCMRGRGYSYGFTLEAPNSDDIVSTQFDGTRVYIPHYDSYLLGGAKIDYVETLQEDSFKVSNPNAIGKCHCRRHDIFRPDARDTLDLGPEQTAA